MKYCIDIEILYKYLNVSLVLNFKMELKFQEALMAFKEKLAEQLAMIEAAQAQTGLFDVIIMMMAIINDHDQ